MLFENLYSGKNTKIVQKPTSIKNLFSVCLRCLISQNGFRKFVVIVPTKLMDEGS